MSKNETSVLNKTVKLIVAFLLANFALAGALHFFSPAVHVSEVQTREIKTPVENSDPPRAAVMNTTPDNPAMDSIEKFRDWVARDFEAALSWATEQPDSDKRNEMLEAACEQIAQNDPARAVMLAENFGLTMER